MKAILFCLLICIAAMNGNAMSFTIQGKIEGLMPGDTLSFERISLLGYVRNPAFDVIVEAPHEFTYNGSHEHVDLYLMTYKPVSRKDVVVNRMGLEFFVEDDTIRIIGAANHIYYCQLEGPIGLTLLTSKVRRIIKGYLN